MTDLLARLLCCIAWAIAIVPIYFVYVLCLLFASLWTGPERARAQCQFLLDSLDNLLRCCTGKTG
jgi:hypothetical protein